MSDLVFQNYNNKCQGWTNPSSLAFGPQITSLSSYYSPAGSTTLVSISGSYFFSYSVVSFGIYQPTTYFINSNIIQFYVPYTLNAGTYSVQVFNGSIGSNIVNYTIDNASGYWILNSSGSITNSNVGGTNSSIVSVTALARGAPVIVTDASYNVPSNVNWIICNYTGGPLTISLPYGAEYTGREITIRNITTNAVNSNASNIILNGVISSTILMAGISGLWVTMVCDGTTNWIVLQDNY
jgi:hypothetical protein